MTTDALFIVLFAGCGFFLGWMIGDWIDWLSGDRH